MGTTYPHIRIVYPHGGRHYVLRRVGEEQGCLTVARTMRALLEAASVPSVMHDIDGERGYTELQEIDIVAPPQDLHNAVRSVARRRFRDALLDAVAAAMVHRGYNRGPNRLTVKRLPKGMSRCPGCKGGEHPCLRTECRSGLVVSPELRRTILHHTKNIVAELPRLRSDFVDAMPAPPNLRTRAPAADPRQSLWFVEFDFGDHQNGATFRRVPEDPRHTPLKVGFFFHIRQDLTNSEHMRVLRARQSAWSARARRAHDERQRDGVEREEAAERARGRAILRILSS